MYWTECADEHRLERLSEGLTLISLYGIDD